MDLYHGIRSLCSNLLQGANFSHEMSGQDKSHAIVKIGCIQKRQVEMRL